MITQLDLVQTNDSKNLSKIKRGFSDTPSVPVNTAVVPKRLHIQLDDDRIFCDYLRFFGKKVKLSFYHEKLLVELFIKGKFFLSKMHKENREDLEYKCRGLNAQIHDGSKIRWSKYYQNSIGVLLKIAYEGGDVLPRGDELENPDKIIAICLEFSGTPLSHLIPRNNQIAICEMIDLMCQLDKGIRVSRIDLTIEFSKDKLDIFEVRKAIDNEDILGVSNYYSISGKDPKNKGKTCTCYFGGQKSDRTFCIYDTEVKHGYSAIRIESRNLGKYADLLVASLRYLYKYAMEDCDKSLHPCSDIEGVLNKFARDINKLIVDYNLSRKSFSLVDKEDKKSWKNRYQVRELPFWEKLKKSFNVEELKYTFVKEEISIKKSISYFTRNFSGLLCGLFDGLGKDLFHDFLSGIMVAKRKGVGMSPFTGMEDKYVELEEFASDGVLGICDEYLLSVLNGIGFFCRPSHLPKKNKKSVLDDDKIRVVPSLSLGVEF